MTAPKVLIVDDEPHIRSLMQRAMADADYAVVAAENAREALELLAQEEPNLVLLDLGLPDRDGLELVPLIKRHGDKALIVISARDAIEEKVAALDLGADDYLTKPFDIAELLARARAALRGRMTRGSGNGRVLVIGDLSIDLASRRIVKGGREVRLTPKEYAVLSQLAEFPGRVITHDRIMAHVWPDAAERHVEYLRVLVRALRQKLETDPQRPRIIGNDAGIGYRLRLAEDL